MILSVPMQDPASASSILVNHLEVLVISSDRHLADPTVLAYPVDSGAKYVKERSFILENDYL